MRVDSLELRVESRARCGNVPPFTRHSSLVTRHFSRAFTLIELLTVIAIIGILAALLTPVLKNFAKPDATVAATRQLLDDVGRARQLAISERTTVFMVFVPTNFWSDALRPGIAPDQWAKLLGVAPLVAKSTIVTQLYAAQWNGYMMVSLRDVGDQPGATYPKDLVRVKTLPPGSFIAPFKFTAPLWAPSPSTPVNVPYPTNRPDLLIYGFPKTNAIPFPTSDVMTNVNFMNQFNVGNIRFVTLPYVAFNYLGQLTPGDGSVLGYDENIPLDYGSIAPALSPGTKLPTQQNPSVIESPEGASTNTTYNIIHIDRLTGRARLERQDAL